MEQYQGQMNNSGSDVMRRLEGLKSRPTIHLVTIGRRTGLPRPVTVWFIYLDGRLFVRTSLVTDWGRNLRANPKVEAEVDGLKFSAEAVQVKDKALIQRLQKRYRRRYHIYDIFSNLFMLRKGVVFFELKPDSSLTDP